MNARHTLKVLAVMRHQDQIMVADRSGDPPVLHRDWPARSPIGARLPDPSKCPLQL
jgi:hypothetical protein